MVTKKRLVWGPTYEEMLHPEKLPGDIRERARQAKTHAPLDPVNLYNITWKQEYGKVAYLVVPKELTGVDANIVILHSKDFPTGSHKVGATYSVLMEGQLRGELVPGVDTLVWPSTGNYGIGGAYVGPRMGYDSLVLLPALMSQERFEKIESYGARYIKTPGCESNVKEIYDECKRLRAENPKNKILNQFEVFANYRFHYYVTGGSALEVLGELREKGIGSGRASAFVSAMGSAGTIAAGDRLKQVYYDCKIVGLEPIQCPTIYENGYGGHDIQGIGDKHVTWIHNVKNMDAIMCIDDMECKMGLQLLTDPVGVETLKEVTGISEDVLSKMASIFGISGVCNLLGAIKTAKFYGMTHRDTIVTIATDAIDRYHSVMKQLDDRYGKMDATKARIRLESIFHRQKLDYIKEGTVHNRNLWHNLKYFTWVEQQGKSVEELNAQAHQEYWLAKQGEVEEIDEKLREVRGR